MYKIIGAICAMTSTSILLYLLYDILSFGIEMGFSELQTSEWAILSLVFGFAAMVAHQLQQEKVRKGGAGG